MKLGLDLYSVRSQPWNALQKLDYCKRLGVDVAHFGLGDLGATGDDAMARVKAHAGALGLEIELGMGSICESSTTFDPAGGSAVAQTRHALDIAAQLGSRVLKVLLGNAADRRTAVPLATHIENCVATLRAVRDQALGLGITLAVENHGDLLGREVAALIEAAGPDFVGACLDPGNSVALAEDPLVTFEHVAPYIVASHIRDSVVWPHPRGAAFQWVALGDGNVGLPALARRYQTECSAAAFTLEILTGMPPRVLPYLDDGYWQAFAERPAWEAARFERLVRQGQPYMGTMVVVARDVDVPHEYREALRAQQLYDVERSVACAGTKLCIGG